MEIIIRTEGMDQPRVGMRPVVASIATTPSAVVPEQFSAMDAIDAGPAPAGPGESGTPPTAITTDERAYAPENTDTSAGTAPEIG